VCGGQFCRRHRVATALPREFRKYKPGRPSNAYDTKRRVELRLGGAHGTPTFQLLVNRSLLKALSKSVDSEAPEREGRLEKDFPYRSGVETPSLTCKTARKLAFLTARILTETVYRETVWSSDRNRVRTFSGTETPTGQVNAKSKRPITGLFKVNVVDFAMDLRTGVSVPAKTPSNHLWRG
jgi:hypothetical protein